MKRLITILCLIAATQLQAQTIAHRDTQFTQYFRKTSGWTAGENSHSIALPNGKTLWLMGATNIDSYNAADTSIGCGFAGGYVKNAMLLQDTQNPGNSITTILDYSQLFTNPAPFKLSVNESGSFLPGDGFVKGDTVYVILKRVNNDWTYGGHYVARIYIPDLPNASAVKSITALPAMNGMEFGNSVLVDQAANYVYIYGSKQNWIIFEPYVARVSLNNILGAWEFYTGSGWSTNAAQAQKISFDAAPTTFSVLKIEGRYYMITQEPNLFGSCTDSKKIFRYTSETPYGPFLNRKTLFTLDDKYRGKEVRMFEAIAHPQFTTNNEMLISYNSSGNCVTCAGGSRVNADLFRPKFIRVPLQTIDPAIGNVVYASIEAPFNWDYAPLPVSFDGSASRDSYGQALTYAWNFGDGNSTTGSAKVQHTYANPGPYTARLIVTNPHGDKDTATVAINALTPTTPAHKDYTFTEYFRKTSGWVASDGTISVQLPNGKSIWMFGDSHIDDYRAADQTVPCGFQVRNAMMVQNASDPSQFATILDQTQLGVNASPVKLTLNDTTLFWPMHGYVKGDTAYLFWIRGGAKNLGRLGSYVAKVYWPTFTNATGIKSLTRVPVPTTDEDKWEWGNAVIYDQSSEYVYIYGFKQDWIVNHPYLARVSSNNMLGTWEFYTGSGWSTSMSAAQTILPGQNETVSPSFSVVKLPNGKYYMITQEIGFLTCGLGRNLYAYESANPYGPFTGKKTLYTIEDKYKGGYMVTYNATAHPQFTADNELLISYNLNDICPSGCEDLNMRMNPDIYRPKFIRVPLTVFDPGLQFIPMQASNDQPAKRGFGLTAYPNPANTNQVNLKFTLPVNSPVQVVVHTVAGKVKMKEQLGTTPAGDVDYPLDVRSLSQGTYIIQVKTPHGTESITLQRQ